MLDRSLWPRLRLLLVAGLLAPGAMILTGLALAYWLRGDQLWHYGWPDLSALGWGAITALATVGFVALLYRTNKHLERALRRTGMKVGTEALKMAGYPVLLVIVTGAAIGEEVLFRGGLQPSIGLVPAALLFGLSHGGWRREMWAYVLAAAVSGGIFGLMYNLTGDLWVPVIGHALHNIGSTLLMGKKVELSREGLWPIVRIIPDEEPEEEIQQPALDCNHVEVGTAYDFLEEPLPNAPDGESPGSDDGDPPSRPAE